MADIDIDPFGEHDKTDSHPDETGETIPLKPGGEVMGGSTWEPEYEQETSFRGMSLRTEVLKNTSKHYIKSYLKAWVKPQKNSI